MTCTAYSYCVLLLNTDIEFIGFRGSQAHSGSPKVNSCGVPEDPDRIDQIFGTSVTSDGQSYVDQEVSKHI